MTVVDGDNMGQSSILQCIFLGYFVADMDGQRQLPVTSMDLDMLPQVADATQPALLKGSTWTTISCKS